MRTISLVLLIPLSSLPALIGPVVFARAVVPSHAAPPEQAPALGPIIEGYRQRVRRIMAEQNIPGLAVAVVDDQRVLWSEGFGYTDASRRMPVDSSTLFSIQSMSKSFTATAVMLAVQKRLVDLDAPITTYLPDFHVNSIFEEHPERLMTLRMLLAHTAGFTHEAPIGNNYDRPNHTFEEHVGSISDTWLLFPVGTRFMYSNLGIDLAGYILQVRSGVPFTEYVGQQIFQPLGMNRSAFSTPDIRRLPNRAVGHINVPLSPPVSFLIVPSGGVYTSADDLARYVIFHINRGAIDEWSILRTDLAEEMYRIPFAPSVRAEYALGLGVGQRHGTRIIGHGGGGFGFLSQMFWYPELKLGGLLLTNSATHTVQVSLIESLLDEIILTHADFYRLRMAASPAPTIHAEIHHGEEMGDAELARLIESHALNDPDAEARWEQYVGTYIITTWGLPSGSFHVSLSDGMLYKGKLRLTEVHPGLFFDPQGQALDLRRQRPTFGNIPLVKANDSNNLLELSLIMLSWPLFLSALLLWPVRTAVRLVRRAASPGLTRSLVVAAWLSALAALLGLGMEAFLFAVPELRRIPWPAPHQDFQWWANALMLLPYLGLLLAAGVLVLAAINWRAAPAGALTVFLLTFAAVVFANQVVRLL